MKAECTFSRTFSSPTIAAARGGPSRGQTAKTVKFVLQWTQSKGGGVSFLSQPQPSQPILPTFVAPSPPVFLANPVNEDNDELELPILSKKKQILHWRAVRERSRRLGRRSSQMLNHPGIHPGTNLPLHPTSIRTIQTI